MMEKQSKGSFWTRLFLGACLFSTVAALARAPETKQRELVAVDEDYVDIRGSVTQCGKYFLLESRTYGDLEVKLLHLFYTIATGSVAAVSKSYSDLDVVIDDSKDEPALVLKWENPEIAKDQLVLSKKLYEEVKACLPPLGGAETT